jgi:hypothetical protein
LTASRWPCSDKEARAADHRAVLRVGSVSAAAARRRRWVPSP